VEINELLSPILYLFRREAADSGGPGRFRGGSGGEICIVPHKTERLDCQTVAHGVTFPNNVGFAGGMPGSPIEYQLIRGSNVRELIAGGELPQEPTPEKIGGELEWLPFRGHFTQLADDVFNVRFTTSGGFGDPLDRDPAAVVADVRNAYVSPEVAKATYGVVVDDDGELDADATEQRRAEIAKRRLEGGTAPAEKGAVLGEGAERTGQVNQTIGIYRENGRVVTACERCHTTLAPADGNYKQGCHEQVTPVTELPYMPDPARYGMDEYLNLRWYHCPECARQLAVELAREGDGLFQDVVLTGSARGE
jgi:N-methylhydantoinase B